MFKVGLACADVTPPLGSPMTGFAARTQGAIGTHDSLTVRALAIENLVLVCVDVIALDTASVQAICQQAGLNSKQLIITALHNHGGPACTLNKLGFETNKSYVNELIANTAKTIGVAIANQQPAELYFGLGSDPKIARNRRHPNGIVDPALPVLKFKTQSGQCLAILMAYACHPVVLSANNLLWTADYPHYVRVELEKHCEQAFFFTGCAGDLNTGHSAHDSMHLSNTNQRSFEEAERIGKIVATAALQAEEQLVTGPVGGLTEFISAGFQIEEKETSAKLAAGWLKAAATADTGYQAVLLNWARWAKTVAFKDMSPIRLQVSAFKIGDVFIVGLPGEIFTATALYIRQNLQTKLGLARVITLAYANACPGYIPPAEEYAHGGYEVQEAHRAYGMPATIAQGTAEKIADTAIALCKNLI